MTIHVNSDYLTLLRDRVNLRDLLRECGSRLSIFHNDTDRNGLCEYQHSYSSGLNDSSLWDDGMPVEYDDPVSGENPPSAASMFSLSSAVFSDLVIQAAREKSQ